MDKKTSVNQVGGSVSKGPENRIFENELVTGRKYQNNLKRKSRVNNKKK